MKYKEETERLYQELLKYQKISTPKLQQLIDREREKPDPYNWICLNNIVQKWYGMRKDYEKRLSKQYTEELEK